MKSVICLFALLFSVQPVLADITANGDTKTVCRCACKYVYPDHGGTTYLSVTRVATEGTDLNWDEESITDAEKCSAQEGIKCEGGYTLGGDIHDGTLDVCRLAEIKK
jgi:hypothetical protein